MHACENDIEFYVHAYIPIQVFRKLGIKLPYFSHLSNLLATFLSRSWRALYTSAYGDIFKDEQNM